MKEVVFPYMNHDSKKNWLKLNKNKKPYIKKICDISKFSAWLVDGEYIRKNICEDFVNYDEHYHLKFIPEKEFWIEKQAVPGEEDYYIDHLLIENRMMASGAAYKKAYKTASIIQKRERNKSKLMKELKKERNNKKELLDKIHKKLLKIKYKKLKIWIINGEIVRDLFDADFASGGHDFVYHFVPKNEIWIDDDISQKERKFILLHELHERRLMKKGKTYREAHRSATEIEDACRHNPRTTGRKIIEEIRKQNK